MKRKVIAFDGGMNEVAESDTLNYSEAKEIVNYEFRKQGKISKRVEADTYDITLDEFLDYIFDEIKYQPQEPYYPPRKTADMIIDVMFPFYGIKAGTQDYVLYLLYKTSGGWDKYVVDVVKYTAESIIRIAYHDGKMVITDNVNKSHYVYVNTDNELEMGINGVIRPLYKPKFKGKVLYQENIETGAFIDVCGLYRYWYTFVTEDGDESNPSPASEWVDAQRFKKSGDSNIDEVMVKAVALSNINTETNVGIKYIRIYREILEYSNGIETRTALFIKEFEVNNEVESFTDTVAILGSELTTAMSYENDISPIGKDICGVGGVLILGGISKNLEFPFDFDRYEKITLRNNNSRSYVDMVVRILIESDIANGLDWEYLTAHPDKIRFYDNDLTSPISVVYKKRDNLALENYTQMLQNYDFSDGDQSWTLNNFTVEDGYAKSLDSTVSASLAQPYSRKVGEYYICTLELYSTIESVHHILLDNQYKLFTEESGTKKLMVILYAGSNDFVIFKDSGVVISRIDNIRLLGNSATTGITISNVDSEMGNSTLWSTNGAWQYDANNKWINSTVADDGYLSTTGNIEAGETYLITGAFELINNYPQYPLLTIDLSEDETENAIKIRGNGWKYFSQVIKASSNHIRIWKSPKGTIKASKYFRITKLNLGAPSIEAYLKIPEIGIGSNKSIYLAYCEDGGASGVNIEEWRAKEYGELVEVAQGELSQNVFDNVRVETIDTILASPMQGEGGKEVINKANINANGMNENLRHSTTNTTYLPDIGIFIDKAPDSVYVTTDDIDYDIEPHIDLNTNTGYYIAGYVRTHYLDKNIIKLVFNNTATENTRVYVDVAGNWKTQDSSNTEQTFGSIPPAIRDGKYFVVLSCRDDDSISLFVYDLLNNQLYAEEKTGYEHYSRYRNLTDIHLGSTNIEMSNWIMDKGMSLSASSLTDINSVWNMANRLPYIDTEVIGYDYTAGTENINVVFGDNEEMSIEKYPNWLAYTKINGKAFPDMNIKKCSTEIERIIPTPSYLRGQTRYDNSVIIFFRNGFNVFTLRGDPNTWRDVADNMIPEKKRDGLVNTETVVVTPFGLIWQTEAGINLWNASTYRNISYGRMNIPIKSNMFAFYIPLTQQYALHSPDDNKTFIYDIPQDKWSIFTDLNIVSSTVLSGGTTIDNVNLFLDDTGKIKKYPDYTGQKTNAEAYATKVFDTYYSNYDSLEVAVKGAGKIDVISKDSQTGTEKSLIDSNIVNYGVNQLPIGMFGDKLEIKVKDSDEIRNVIVVYNDRRTRR